MPARRAGFGARACRGLLLVDVVAVAIALAGHLRARPRQIGPPAVHRARPGCCRAARPGVAARRGPAIFGAYGLYERQTRAIAPSSLDEVADLFHALLAGSLVLLVAGQGFEKLLDWSIYSPLEARCSWPSRWC